MKNLFYTLLLLCTCAVSCNTHAQKLHDDLTLPYMVQEPASSSMAPPVVVLLHGYGSNEKDLFALRSYFPKSYLIVSVRAPLPADETGYQWYHMQPSGGRHDGNQADVKNSAAKIRNFINEIVTRYHADAGNVYVIGFSQGAVMSYEAGLAYPDLVKGIGVLSGCILPSSRPGLKASPALKHLHIFIAHGTADDRLAYGDALSSKKFLEDTLKIKPAFHSYPGMKHTITKEEMHDLVTWLTEQ